MFQRSAQAAEVSLLEKSRLENSAHTLEKISQWASEHLVNNPWIENDTRNRYPSQLMKQPKLLLSRLNESISQQIDAYENKHAYEPNEAVRYCLNQLHVLQLKMSNDIKTLENNESNHDAFRKHHIVLCGLIWHLIDLLYMQQVAESHEFFQCLLGIAAQYPHNSLEAKSEFNQYALISKNRLQDLGEFFSNEKRHFATALNSVEADALNLPYDSLMRLNALELRRDIIQNKVECEKENKPFDFHYYTTVLNQTKSIIAEPENPERRHHYINLMSHCPDKRSSTSKKVIGGMLMFAGVAMFVGGFIAGFNGFAPAIPLGLVFGAATFLGGLKIYNDGCESGPLNAMRLFSKTTREHRVPMHLNPERAPLLTRPHPRYG